jgi:hypothetical protein
MTERPGLSRRALFALAGGGAALVSVLAVWRRREPPAEAGRPAEPAVERLVDYDGWIVTPADKQALSHSRETS